MRIALVTGASRGIGKQAALALARRGFHVVLTARTVHEGDASATMRSGELVKVAGSLDSTTAEIAAAGGTSTAIPMDLLDRASVDAAFDRTLAEHGRIDALVNNAIYQGVGPMERLLDLTPADALATITGNFLHQLHTVQRAVPVMAANGGGAIVNVTSHVATHDPKAPVGSGGWGLGYAASKGAFHRIVGILNVEHRPEGIRAFNVDPGHVMTERQMATGAGKQYEDAGYVGTPAEVPGEVIAWLADGTDPRVSDHIGNTVIAGKIYPTL